MNAISKFFKTFKCVHWLTKIVHLLAAEYLKEPGKSTLGCIFPDTYFNVKLWKLWTLWSDSDKSIVYWPITINFSMWEQISKPQLPVITIAVCSLVFS